MAMTLATKLPGARLGTSAVSRRTQRQLSWCSSFHRATSLKWANTSSALAGFLRPVTADYIFTHALKPLELF